MVKPLIHHGVKADITRQWQRGSCDTVISNKRQQIIMRPACSSWINKKVDKQNVVHALIDDHLSGKKCFAHMNEDGLGIVTSILTIIPVTSQWSLSFKSRAISWGFLHVDRRSYMHARRAAPEPEHTGMRFGLWCHFGDHMRRCGYAKRTWNIIYIYNVLYMSTKSTMYICYTITYKCVCVCQDGGAGRGNVFWLGSAAGPLCFMHLGISADCPIWADEMCLQNTKA